MVKNIGKYIYGAVMLIFGLSHLANGEKMAGMVPAFIPGGVIWVYVTGLALIAAAVSIFINKKTKLATLLLAILIGIFVATIHVPNVINKVPYAEVTLLKDVALIGAALIISGISKDND
ncbi:DoxX family protein [Leptospira perolatii]|uniref:DoxX family protein n=1 Tax=Leptospira perolatii TaxID=2023191 RepID=A0A2M9ZST7_9LEPT|nr:DoxX family protein [Leptospira perolatii]PJZ71495.1 DoxX family protein [Leptospira perolatii]PJZ75029.1 DoxX family protein [Leptospira perolatii]